MSKPEFVYTTYIETTAEKLWQALTDGDFTERYWFGKRRVGLEGGLALSASPVSGAPSVDRQGPRFRSAAAARLLLGHPAQPDSASANAPPASPSIWSRAAGSVRLTVTHDELDERRQDLARHFRRLADGAGEPEEPARKPGTAYDQSRKAS